MEKTWYNDPNVALPDVSTAALMAQSLAWIFKALLKGDVGVQTLGRWTMYYSCDGAVAGTANDAVDRWGTSFDSTKLVRATAGSAHSWAVMKSPPALGPYYVIIDLSGTVDSRINLIFSKAAPTGGSTTARPTATDEWAHVADSQWVDTVAAAHNAHLVKDVDGNFFFFTSKTGSGRFTLAILCQTLAETRTNWTHKVLTTLDYRAAGTSILAAGNIYFFSSPSASNANGVNRGRNYTGSAVIFPGLLVPSVQTAGGSGLTHVFTTEIAGADSQDGKYDSEPIVAVQANTSSARLGRYYDLKWAPANTVEGTLSPITGAPYERCCVGDCWVPWTGTVGPVL